MTRGTRLIIATLLCTFASLLLAQSDDPAPSTRPKTLAVVPTDHPGVATTLPAVRPDFNTRLGQRVQRVGDEIMVCGQLFHTGAPVVLFTDPGGYDAYRVERRFGPWDKSNWDDSIKARPDLKTPTRYGPREDLLTPEQLERIRGGGWDLPLLQSIVDQFVIHYDACGLSKICFEVLHDHRGLSVHFLLDLDGTIYQTLDLKERARHSTVANSRSIGIEIANIGAYAVGESDLFKAWYTTDETGKTRISIPARHGDGGLRIPNVIPRPARDKPVWGTIQGKRRRMYDLTPEQYDSLIKLTATLCTIFPKLECDYPRNEEGELIRQKLPDEQYAKYRGLIGHYHVQADKSDPGPAFQWNKVVEGARALLQTARPEPPADAE